MVDLDGVLADSRWRAHLLNDSNPDVEERYHNYHYYCGFDSVLHENIRTIRRYVPDGFSKVIITTARPISVSKQTQRWLDLHGIRPLNLLMRAVGDRRSSAELKVAMLGHIQSLVGPVHWAFDDRKDIVEALSRYGVPLPIHINEQGIVR